MLLVGSLPPDILSKVHQRSKPVITGYVVYLIWCSKHMCGAGKLIFQVNIQGV